MGTQIQSANLTLDDFRGLEGCNELLVETRPDVIQAIHERYFAAGADVVETNSFGGMPYVLAEFDIGHRAFELNKLAAEVARKAAAAKFSTKDRPRFVAGSMGPGTKLVTLGHIAPQETVRRLQGLRQGPDRRRRRLPQHRDLPGHLLQVKLAVLAARDAMAELGREVPIFCTVTIETTGTMLVGSDIATAVTTLEALPVDVIGLNCATGPDLMQESVRHLGKTTTRTIMVMPNAGLPRNVGGKAVYDLTPAELARFQARFVTDFGIGVVGGCCGTTPEHVAAMAAAMQGLRPASAPKDYQPQLASLFHSVPLDQDSGPLIVGERTNANGSKKFRELMVAGDVEGMLQMAKEQVHEGSHVLDVCTAFVGRDEAGDMLKLLRPMVQQVTAPVMVDSTADRRVEKALQAPGPRDHQLDQPRGRRGEGRRVCRLARATAPMFVALTIDEEGMAKTAERKLASPAPARHRRAPYGMHPGDLIFDPLTFTIGTGDEASRKLACRR
jgi:5-methyltetrahydrofolate--homocysteine methyltransferase